MSDAMECPESPEELQKKMKSMEFEWVRITREGEDDVIKGHLQPKDENVWEIKANNGSFARFSLKNVVSICPYLIQIKIKPI